MIRIFLKVKFRTRILLLITTALACAFLSVMHPMVAASGFDADIQGERYAIIVQNIGPGLAMNFRELLIEQGGVEESNILCYGCDEPFAGVCVGKPVFEEVSKGFGELAGRLSEGDTVLVLFACHMQRGFLINNTLSYEELNGFLTSFPEGVQIIVIIEGCHAGAILQSLVAADLIYASAGPDEPCYGGWLRFFLDALGKDMGAFSLADTDGNGFVSFGEAFDYASDDGRLAEWYSNLPRDVWPPADFHPKPTRSEAEFQYWFFLNPHAPATF
jgi:hypothetical protein